MSIWLVKVGSVRICLMIVAKFGSDLVISCCRFSALGLNTGSDSSLVIWLFMISSMDVFCDWYGLDRPGAEDIRAYWMALLKEQFHFTPRKPDRLLVDGESINLGNVTVDVIHAPGHTPGHTCFHFREPEVLFLGDYDLTPFGPWYGDVTSSIEQTISSVEKLRQIPAKVWLTCHETGVFDQQPGTIWDDYLEVIQTRERKLLDFLSEPRTVEDIIHQWIVYLKPREPKEFFEQGERAIMGKHLESLVARGEVYARDGHYEKES